MIEANDQRRWVGSSVVPEVHIPPIGLLYVASFARAHHPDVRIEILETSLDARSDEDLLAKLLEFGPDAVGIRSISLFEEELRRVAQLTIPPRRGSPALKGTGTFRRDTCIDRLRAIGFGSESHGRNGRAAHASRAASRCQMACFGSELGRTLVTTRPSASDGMQSYWASPEATA